MSESKSDAPGVVLFLDDDEARTGSFKSRCPRALTTKTAQGMIALLEALEAPAEAVYLDHDLDGQSYVNPHGKNTGTEVCRWIIMNEPKINRIVVHTHNHIQGPRMAKALENMGYNVELTPFYTMFDGHHCFG